MMCAIFIVVQALWKVQTFLVVVNQRLHSSHLLRISLPLFIPSHRHKLSLMSKNYKWFILSILRLGNVNLSKN